MMKLVPLLWVIVVIALWTDETDAGSGIQVGTIDYSMYLQDQPPCIKHEDCLELCRSQAKNPATVDSAKCIKFVGNRSKYCCCYGLTTNACCQLANSGLDCVPL